MYHPMFHDYKLGVAVSIVQLIARKYEIGEEMDYLFDHGEWSAGWGHSPQLLEELNEFLVPAGYKGYQDFWNTVEFRTSPKWARDNLPHVEDVYHEDEYRYDSVHGQLANR